MITIIPLRIVVVAPFVSRSSDSGAVGIDLPLARNAAGKVMIAGSHVVGKLGAALRELRDLMGDDPLAQDLSQDLATLLPGHENSLPQADRETADKNSNGREARRALTASDFVLASDINDAGTRTRVAIDNVKGTVLEGMMQVIEQPFATGQELAFEGQLRVVGPLNVDRKTRIIKALQFVTQMGGLRSVGYGEIQQVEERNATLLHPAQGNLADATRILARLRFDDVFCAGEARNSPNTYTSAEFVPGGVIKGAIARQMLASVGKSGFLDEAANKGAFTGDLAQLAQEFGKIRILHAQPAAKDAETRPRRAIPCSLAAIENAGDPVVVDLAMLDSPLAPVLINGIVPVSPFDWKDPVRQAAKAVLGIADGPKRLLRVRTQIDDNSKAAVTSRLFGVEYTRGDEHDFLAEIDLSNCNKPGAVFRGLQAVLAHGLTGIGRSGAYAQVTLEAPAENLKHPKSNRIVAVLQSAALLRDPSRPTVNLRDAYSEAFAELGLPENIELKAAFVSERLAGGGFFRNRLEGAKYKPWLLTEAGATFVYQSKDGSEIDPSTLFPNGLAIPTTVLVYHGLETAADVYRRCPYLPQNGYGELVVSGGVTEQGSATGRISPLGLARIDPVDALEFAHGT